MKSLEGKSILINVWATWCGPCQSEQPKLQKLYDQVKDRSDVQILTFNIDEDAGLVAPFLKEKGYTFPVVVAYNYVNSLLDSIGIPHREVNVRDSSEHGHSRAPPGEHNRRRDDAGIMPDPGPRVRRSAAVRSGRGLETCDARRRIAALGAPHSSPRGCSRSASHGTRPECRLGTRCV